MDTKASLLKYRGATTDMEAIYGRLREEHDIYGGKRFRDDIHLDVNLSPLEMKVVDTPDFQRLDGLKQLGTAYLLYRGAKHTRFEHSIGAVAATQQLIDLINSKATSQEGMIPPKARVLARMCALLHDIAHVPFGHSLEQEARVVKSRHDSRKRLDSKIGKGAKIGDDILGEELREQVIATLTAEDKDLSRLEFPYVADMVCNTICADLLDYLPRDIKNTGLVASYDPRFLSYFALVPDKQGRKRMALRLWRRKARGVRQEVIRDVLGLLRLRCMLAEKVYYHPNKMLTSAMISKAVEVAEISEDELMQLTDEMLLARLVDPKNTKNEMACVYAQRIKERSLYKPLYWVSPVDENDLDERWVRLKQLAQEYNVSPHSPENRARAEARLEKMADLDSGSSVIYCPDLAMQLKPAKVLVQLPDERVLPLEEVVQRDISDEVKGIQRDHKKLWKFYVFVAPKYWSDDCMTLKAEWINAACIELFAPWNDNKLFTAAGQKPYERWALKVCEEEKALDEVPALLSLGTKLVDNHFWDDPRERLIAQLQALRQGKIQRKLVE